MALDYSASQELGPYIECRGNIERDHGSQHVYAIQNHEQGQSKLIHLFHRRDMS